MNYTKSTKLSELNDCFVFVVVNLTRIFSDSGFSSFGGVAESRGR